MAPTEIEASLLKHFALLFSEGDTVLVQEEAFDFKYIRCALTKKGRAVFVEVNNLCSPYSVFNAVLRKGTTGKIRMEETELRVVEGGEKKYFIGIYCRNSKLNLLFNRLMSDLIWHLIHEGPRSGDPWDYLNGRLKGWGLLFSTDESKSEEKGLIGELLILKHFITQYKYSVSIWSGPLGGIKDFRLSNRDVEVKTTSVRYGYIVEISGLYQTQSQQNCDNLIFIRLEESPNGIINVSELIKDLKAICSDIDLQDLEDRLEQFSEETLISQTRWNILENVVIKVDERFPKISENSFVKNRLPAGIIKISWAADISSLEKKQIKEYNFLSNEG